MPQTLPKRNCFTLLLLITCVFITSYSFAQDGTIDSSFGDNGKVITDFGGDDYAKAMAIQPDSKIVVGGYGAGGNAFLLIRYNIDGSIDNDFGVNGKVTTYFEGLKSARLQSIKMQKDGKIVAAGYISNTYDFVLVRYKSTGDLDSTFGVNGKVINNMAGTDYCYSIDIQEDGKIVAVGASGCNFLVCRYNANGTFDASFGAGGKQFTDIGGCDEAYSVKIQTDGKIVVSGGSFLDTHSDIVVCRYDINGSLDSSFGINGYTITDIHNQDYAYTSILQPDGNIVVAGFSQTFETVFALARYNTSGHADSSFAEVGNTITEFNGDAVVKAVALQQNGEIIAVGNLSNGGTSVLLARYKANGILDKGFGTLGQVKTSNGAGNFASASVIQDSKILVVGYTSLSSTGIDFSITRYNITDASLPVTLTSFTAAPAKSVVLLNWSTTTETNNSYFNIERSDNSTNFTAIGRVEGKGNSNQLQQYAYSDAQPLKGDNYYRLKQVDKDGRYSYSKTVHIVFGAEPNIKAYPNPAKNSVKVSGLSAGATLAVTGMTGKAMGQYTATGAEYTLNIQNLPAGIYFIRVQQGGKTTTLKMVKE